jgi:glycolate oxidase
MSGLAMPKPDAGTLNRRAEIVADMRIIVPGEGVVDAANEMRAFESDGLTAYRQLPLVVVLPETVTQVSRILKYCNERNIRVVPRGSGTSLSGGALPLEDAVLLVMSRFNRILAIDYPNRTVVAQPGVTNLGITTAVEQEGFYYAPDPSSQIACSIGGNVAENSGGVHCLKYGLTANNVLGIEMVLMNGEVVRLGGNHLDQEGYDLLGVMTGSEGLLGVVTEVTVRILKKPETARALLIGFPTSEEGGKCVADIIGAGIIPGGMEMMDRPAIHAAEDFVHAGYPLDVEALLIVELDGPSVEVDHLIGLVEGIDHLPHIAVGAGAVELLGRAQGGFPGGRPHLARLLLHGRHHPAQGTAARAGRHARAVGEIRARRRQRLPRRRRQPASADPLRRQCAGRTGQG